MAAHLRDQLGRFGIWRPGALLTPAIAASIEQAGYGALWVGGSPDGDLRLVEDLLAATGSMIVGTSIVNIWKDQASLLGASYARLDARFPGRFVLGVGAGHPEATASYARPYEALAGYVGQLTATGVPPDRIVLAALGPKVLRLAGERAGGAIPYLVPPEHTSMARAILGPGPLLAPEQKAVLDTDEKRARALGRKRVKTPYLGLVNYTSNLRRLGWSDADLAGDGSDALIDALVAHGDARQVAGQLSKHLDAGADHVVVQLLTAASADAVPGYQQLGRALGL